MDMVSIQPPIVILTSALHGVVFLCDEFVFHWKRGLPKWERMGHPLDTFTVLLGYAWVQLTAMTFSNLVVFGVLAILSCLFVTKDEFVHAKHCTPMEQWLHALLFVCHPLLFLNLFLMWPYRQMWMAQMMATSQTMNVLFVGGFCVTFIFFLYQIVFWNFVIKEDNVPVLEALKNRKKLGGEV